LLYGNLLHRNADKEGYNFYLTELQTKDGISPDVIYEFFTSEEFLEKFIVNQTPNELARNLLHSFFEISTLTRLDVKLTVRNLIQIGFPAVVRNLLSDKRFVERHGTLGVPKYAENVALDV
jgi:hypothetical protein